MSENNSGKESSKGPKKAGGRVITDKRREQNRRSQKAYRERQKQRLEELEEQASNKDPLPHARSSSASVINLGDAFTAAGDLSVSSDATLPSWDLVIRPPQSGKSHSPTLLSSFMPLTSYDTSDPPPEAEDNVLTTPTFSSGLSSHSQSSPANSAWMYRNFLRLQTENSFTAMIAIANSLGITDDSYINDDPSPFPLAVINKPIDIELHRSRYFAHIKPDLRPSSTQLTISHPSFVDCIVFPKFRDRIILFANRGEFDMWDLFMDMMNDGLVCWGSSDSSRGMENGVAWSMRSWEARPWFLRKWWFLVGDKDDEMWTGSRWWWSMRGEEVD